MPTGRNLRFTGPFARLQYVLLMSAFRLVRSRWRYGQLAGGLGRVFGPRTAVYLTLPGGAPFKIYLNDGYWTRFGLYHTHYEPEIAAVLHAARGHTPLFCDLGANNGYWTTRAAAHFTKVFAVEAALATYARLTENTAHLPSVAPIRAAVHANSGETLTFVNTYLSHASARLAGDTAPGTHDNTETVETIAIDDLVPDSVPALIKLDVEGAEIAAFEGAARAITDGSVLIYEDHGNDPDCAPSAYLMQNPDMQVFSLENGFARVETLDAIRAGKTDSFNGYNFLAAHRTSPLLAAISNALQNHRPADTT